MSDPVQVVVEHANAGRRVVLRGKSDGVRQDVCLLETRNYDEANRLAEDVGKMLSQAFVSVRREATEK